MKILLGTGNRNKAHEISKIFNKHMHELGQNIQLVFPWQLSEKFPDPEENGKTLRENAFIKAKAFAEFFKLPAVSDDTGLFVDALNGSPGIFAARYAGENCTYNDNVQKMLLEMKDIPQIQRTARFMCVSCLHFPGDDKNSATFKQGILEGEIASESSGSDGFGYDPIFTIKSGKTLAEISAIEKNQISHRGLAMEALFKEIFSQDEIIQKLKNI